VSTTRARPVLDRPTVLSYAQVGYYTWLNYSFGASQALLRDEQGVSKTLAALHGTFFALGGICGALIAPHVMRRFGRGVTMRIGAIGLAGGIALYTVPSEPIVTWSAAFLAPLFGALILVGLNAFLVEHQGPAGPAAMTQANAVGSFAGIIAPFALGAAAASVLGWRTGIWVLIAAIIVVEILRGRHLDRYNTGQISKVRRDPIPTAVWVAASLLGLYVAVEFCLLLWGPDLLRERANFGPAGAAAAVGATSIGMFVGRLSGARLAQTATPQTLLIGSTCVALIAFSALWFSTSGWFMIAMLLITGAGIGLLWPLGMTQVIQHSRGQSDRASAIAIICAGSAIAVVPFLLGALADRMSVHTAFLIVPLMLIVTLIMLTSRVVDRVAGRTP
jgi:MFS family permease